MRELYENLLCPVCGAPLRREGGSLYCLHPGKRHCFDLGATGYVNLLPPGKAGNARTGDDGDMIRARRDFLALGLYDGISDGAARVAAAALGSRGTLCLADAGCGEGYHTCRIADGCRRLTGGNVLMYGFDASRRGAEAGARRAARCGLTVPPTAVCFAAANLFSLPLPSAWADAVFSLFAPIAGEENRRVLKDDGFLVVGASGKRHLYELRELLYDTPREAEGEIRTPDGFVPVREEEVTYRVLVPTAEALGQLFRMTPFVWRTPREGVERLQRTASLSVTVDVLFRVFRKN